MATRKMELPETNPDDAATFLESWHGLLPAAAGGGHRWTSITQLPLGVAYADDLLVLTDSIRSGAASLEELMYPSGSGTRRQGLYHAVGVTKDRPPLGKRGGEGDVEAIPGAWADLDVRADAFRDWGHTWEVIARMDTLRIGPQIVVSTGSGGAHAYWRFQDGLSPEAAKMYSKRIRRFIQAEFGVKVDNVAQANRVMRLPGAIRFPKSADDPIRDAVPVQIVRNDKTFCDGDLLQVVTQDTWDAVERLVAEQRSRLSEDWARGDEAFRMALSAASMTKLLSRDGFTTGRLEEDTSGSDDKSWSGHWRRFEFEFLFNERVSWGQILEPMGWTRFGEPDSQGRQSWTRPGGGKKNPRSAVTDWEMSPHVMSLLSDAEETGLSHLYTLADDATERRHKLTKVRVAAELYAGGSVEKLIGVWARRLGEES